MVCTSSPAFLMGCPLDRLCCVFVIVCVGILGASKLGVQNELFFSLVFFDCGMYLASKNAQHARKHAQNCANECTLKKNKFTKRGPNIIPKTILFSNSVLRISEILLVQASQAA